MSLLVLPPALDAVLARSDDAPGSVSAPTVAVVVAVLLLVVGGGLLRTIGVSRARRAAEEREARESRIADGRSHAHEPLLTEARALFVAVQEAWDARDDRRMARLLGPELLADWRRHRDDFDAMGWRSRISVLGPPRVRLVGDLGHDGREERVVVAVSCDVSSWIATDAGELLPRGTGAMEDDDLRIDQQWTLGRRGGRWFVVAIDEAPKSGDGPD